MAIADDVHAALYPFLDRAATHITIAYSGGLDSSVLLHAVASLRADFNQHRYLAVHINHQLNSQADRWQRHAHESAGQLGVPFNAISVTVNPEHGGIEAAAREARYAALLTAGAQDGLVLTGQHQDDQTETLLLQLRRGAGPAGLSAMPAEAKRGQKLIARPFLELSRQTLLTYAEYHNLTWVDDDSNQDDRFDRNFLRNQVIPVLAQRWPGFSAAVSRSARLCAQQQSLLDEVTEQKLSQLVDTQQRLSVDGVLQQSRLWQQQIIRSWLALSLPRPPSEAQLNDLIEQLGAPADSQIEVTLKGYQIRRYDGWLYLLKRPLTQIESDRVSAKTTMSFADGACHLTLTNLADNQLDVGGCVMSARFKPTSSEISKPLSQWFKAWKVPPWERQRYVAIYAGAEVIALIKPDGTWIRSEQGKTIDGALNWRS